MAGSGAAIANLFIVLFIMMFLALGISEMVSIKKGKPPGKMAFGLLYLLMALGLIAYKVQNP
jgi:hypothetical protein